MSSFFHGSQLFPVSFGNDCWSHYTSLNASKEKVYIGGELDLIWDMDHFSSNLFRLHPEQAPKDLPSFRLIETEFTNRDQTILYQPYW